MDKLKKYLDYSVERALKTCAQAAIGVITAASVTGAFAVDWMNVLSVSALAGVMSLLMSVLVYDKPVVK